LGIVVKIESDLFDLVPGYLKNRHRDVDSMRECLARGDYETIRIKGHSMRGSGSGYGFDEISKIGALLETDASAGRGVIVEEHITRLADYLANLEVIPDDN